MTVVIYNAEKENLSLKAGDNIDVKFENPENSYDEEDSYTGVIIQKKLAKNMLYLTVVISLDS